MLSKLIGAAIILSLVAGCSGRGSHPISVSSRASAATVAPASDATPASLDLANGISLDRIRMVVRTIEAEPSSCAPAAGTAPAAVTVAAPGGADDGTDVDEDGCGVLRGPALVDLSGADLVAGALSWVATVTFPDDTYGNVEFRINTIPAGKATSDAMREMATLHASIAVDGTIDGQPFQFALPWEIAQERAGTFVVGPEATPNMTLDFDPSGWFGTPAARLDPRDPTNQGAIFANIRASIRTFPDDDRDGCDDADEAGCTPAP